MTLTVQNGKGSASRIGDQAAFGRRLDEVKWPRRCQACGNEFEATHRFCVCPVCKRRVPANGRELTQIGGVR